eukprot:CAMPEP_0195085312 /NCGR_PEP_ID=MMETSP0448-20130528/25769_1 /TAXON_ID=66468 /ORGANISM="Heterocapsa triquestra, Strain CCMP 448" /LENGTH=59 /DNA_ID=CAMNT_0040118703 /DNA_START=23 /DNA_END=202 /DNA_ORIENTATION=-
MPTHAAKSEPLRLLRHMVAVKTDSFALGVTSSRPSPPARDTSGQVLAGMHSGGRALVTG